jgi:hypothetical protein
MLSLVAAFKFTHVTHLLYSLMNPNLSITTELLFSRCSCIQILSNIQLCQLVNNH